MRYPTRSPRLLLLAFLACAVAVLSTPSWATDAAGLVRQIQKGFSAIQRHIVTQPHQAESELAESQALLETLKAEAPGDRNIPRLEKKLGQLSDKLAKRLGRTVRPVTPSAPPPPAAAPAPAARPAAPPPMAAAAAAGAKLPGSVTSRIRKIDQALDKAGKALDKGSVQRAQMEYRKAEKYLKEIQDRYGDKAPADHPEMTALAGRMADLNGRVEAAAGAAAAAAQAEQDAEAANAALADQWNSRLSPYVTRGGPQELQDRVWDLTGEAAKQNRSRFEQAKTLLAEYDQVQFPRGKSMDLKNTEFSLREKLKWLGESYAKQATEQGSEAWVTRLEPYVTPMGGKQLIASYTANVQQMQRQQAIYREANALFQEYLKADFPQGKSQRLQTIEAKLADELAQFPDVMQRSTGAQAEQAGAKLDQEIAFLNSKQEWKTDPGKLPYVLSAGRIAEARALIARAAEVLPAGDPRLAALNDKMATLEGLNDERRQARTGRTRMLPDRFGADGANAVKAKANALVEAKFPGIRVLRTTVISPDWKEESVDEWTDTTHSAVRHRTTRSVTAQVAGKKADGEVRLYTVHVAKDRRSDGSWGQLYGNLHSDLGDAMLEENVGK